jgi:uncharacterized protein with GYD domain
MAKFLMMGKYSPEAIKGISAERTKKVLGVIEQAGGKVYSMYALLGVYDLVFVVELGGIQEALKTSIAITKLTDIAFSTLPAVTVEEFDKIAG